MIELVIQQRQLFLNSFTGAQMRTAVLVSFDLIRTGEPHVSLAIGSLLAGLRGHISAGELDVHHFSVNLLDGDSNAAVQAVETTVLSLGLSPRDAVAISGYVRSEPLTQRLIGTLRREGFAGTIILGGYQVSWAAGEDLPALYPGVDVFISGYAEQALADVLLEDRPGRPRVVSEPVDFQALPSPYLCNSIPVEDGQGMVRVESKRGCPFRCSFCAHRDLRGNRVHARSSERVRTELEFLAAKKVGKINFVDPVFNQGPEHLGLMEHMLEIGLRAQLALQSRFELIRGEQGERFMELARDLGAHLEFGLQTAEQEEGRAINRRNGMEPVADVMRTLASRGISFEVSLIYGLPGQTVDSFRRSIEFVRENGCSRITAWPLMLLRGTELMAQRDQWGFEERPEGRFGIPVVRRSNSFSEGEWEAMKEIADSLAPNARV